MNSQYFKFKIKDEYLPTIIHIFIQDGKIKIERGSVLSIDLKYFRKLKIQNIENSISEDDKVVLEFLINRDFTILLTPSEYESLYTKFAGIYGVSGTSGSVGVSGIMGTSGSMSQGWCTPGLNNGTINNQIASLGLQPLPYPTKKLGLSFNFREKISVLFTSLKFLFFMKMTRL